MIQSGPGPMPSFQEFVIKFFDKRKFLASFRNLPLKRSKEEDSSLVIHLTWSISVDSLRQFEANAKLAKVANNFIFRFFMFQGEAISDLNITLRLLFSHSFKSLHGSLVR